MTTDMLQPPKGGMMQLPIRLDQFLKLSGIAQTGGHAKLLIQDGEVQVNGEVELRRRRKLNTGDVVCVNGEETSVVGDT